VGVSSGILQLKRTTLDRTGSVVNELASDSPQPSAAQDERKRFRVVSIVAAMVAVPFVALHLWQVFSMSTLEGFVRDMGGPMPAATQLLVDLGHLDVLPVLVIVIDLAVFALMYRLARRYWIGLLFAPVFCYLALSAVYYLLIVAPVFNTITLVK
jgi:hypothetical protein